MVENRPDIAFVEYDTVENAAAARNALQGFRVTSTNILKISFAKQ
jgi:U1 small nuclear ribonucleoprotein A